MQGLKIDSDSPIPEVSDKSRRSELEAAPKIDGGLRGQQATG
jgi:hypothetical protein